MAKNPEYAEFIKHVEGRVADTLPKDEEIAATEQEVGWWKKFQFTRMIRHARAGQATDIELKHLAEHGIFYPTTPKEYRLAFLEKKPLKRIKKKRIKSDQT